MPETPDSSEPINSWEVPTSDGNLELDSFPGRATVVLGPNGAGKSALAAWMHQNFPSDKSIKRLVAHRQIWMKSSASDLTPARRSQMDRTWDNEARSSDSRWKNPPSSDSTSRLLLDLSSRENYHNASLVGKIRSEGDLSDIPNGPLDRMNQILQKSGFAATISIDRNGEFVTTRSNGESYPIAKMSDGEKSALILAGETILADEGSVILLDEPERHIHRAVSTALVSAITADRRDCSFFIFTHDVELSTNLLSSGARAIIVESSSWSNDKVLSWKAQEMPDGEDLPNGVTQALLGARKEALFCEGEIGGTDQEIYSILYPNRRVIPVGSCSQVIRCTRAMKELSAFTWITATGIIDSDRRTLESIESLAKDEVIVSGAHEIENLLHLPTCQKLIAAQQSAALDSEANQMLVDSTNCTKAELGRTEIKQRTVEISALASARDHLRLQVDSLRIEAMKRDELTISHTPQLSEIAAEYEELLGRADLTDFLLKYPIRESGTRMKIANSLHCPRIGDYEQRVRVLIRSDTSLADELRAVIERRSLETDKSFPQ